MEEESHGDDGGRGEDGGVVAVVDVDALQEVWDLSRSEEESASESEEESAEGGSEYAEESLDSDGLNTYSRYTTTACSTRPA